MKDLYPLYGIVTVLNTPFTEDDQLDITGLRENVRHALKAGVAGFLVPAMASEVYKLTHHERLQMVDIVLQEVNGQVPVIAGAGETDLNKAKKLLGKYLDLGCSHVLFQIPYTNTVQFYQDFMCLADLQPGVIMLQDWDASGKGLPDELICRLFVEVEAFRCLKVETVPAGPKYSRILGLTGGRLHVSGGWAVSQMIEGLTRGVHAFMPTGMHFAYCRIYNEYMAGNIQSAERLFNEILPVLAFSNQHLDISVHFFKHLLYQQGIYATPLVRKPILEFDPIHHQSAAKLIEKIIAIENRLEHGLRLVR
jgi:dihydrodipicolinate synthase/N-acetylneuraminate lyase